MLSAKERTVACWLLAATILAGYAMPGLSELFAPYKATSLFFLIVLSLLPLGRMQPSEIFTFDTMFWRIVLWQLGLLPAIILSAAYLGHVNSSITILMVTTASAGSIFASPTFAELLQVNKQRALQSMLLSTFLMPLSYFIFFTVVMHAQVTIDPWAFFNRCMTFLVMPLGFFLVYCGIEQDLPRRIPELVESVSRRATVLALMCFGIGIVGPARDLLWSDPSHFALYFAIVTILGVGMAYLTAIVMFRQVMNDALTASIVSGFRNVGLGFVLLSGTSSAASIEYVGISQIPVFLAPLVLNYLVNRRKTAKLDLSENAVLSPA